MNVYNTFLTYNYCIHAHAGVEKNNDAKRNYFSSNLHDPAGEVLKAEWRLEQTEQYRRRKRNYCKRNLDYWQGTEAIDSNT